LVNQLRGEFPEHRVVISTTTDTGQHLAAARFGRENVFYFPLDVAFCVRRYVAALSPELIVIAETEFWPNLLRISRRSGAKIAIVNARISDRSFPGYRRWRSILGRVLQNVSVFLAQTNEDGRRLIEIGAPPDRVFTGGNLKFDISEPAATVIVERLRVAVSGAGPVVVCGSTVEGEEALLIAAFQQILAQYPTAVMLLAPRHPERFPEVEKLLQESPVHFSRRSQWDGAQLSGGVLLLDSIGELAGLYALADIAVVGGSFVPRGGHNILEPALHGVPIVVGPHTENFRDIVKTFQGARAVRVVDASELPAVLLDLLANDSERRALGERARQTLESNRGATELTLQKLKDLLPARAHEAHPA
jgi:3-deoxy-D-manno-octulosonic-acid transferase